MRCVRHIPSWTRFVVPTALPWYAAYVVWKFQPPFSKRFRLQTIPIDTAQWRADGRAISQDFRIFLIYGWTFEKVFLSHFSRSWWKTVHKTCIIQTRVFSLTLLDLVTLDGLNLKNTHRKIRMVLIGVPNTIHANLYQCWSGEWPYTSPTDPWPFTTPCTVSNFALCLLHNMKYSADEIRTWACGPNNLAVNVCCVLLTLTSVTVFQVQFFGAVVETEAPGGQREPAVSNSRWALPSQGALQHYCGRNGQYTNPVYGEWWKVPFSAGL